MIKHTDPNPCNASADAIYQNFDIVFAQFMNARERVVANVIEQIEKRPPSPSDASNVDIQYSQIPGMYSPERMFYKGILVGFLSTKIDNGIISVEFNPA